MAGVDSAPGPGPGSARVSAASLAGLAMTIKGYITTESNDKKNSDDTKDDGEGKDAPDNGEG